MSATHSHSFSTHLPGAPRVYSLDVIRGAAATLVVLHHVLRATPGLDSAGFWGTASSTAWWVPFVFLGDFSVTVFFVLSGACLVLAFWSDVALGPQWVVRFGVRRLFRVYPLYILAILVYFAYRPIFSVSHISPDLWVSPQFDLPVSGWTWTSNLLMFSNLTNGPRVFNNALWSLPIEMQFYLFFPLLLVALMKVRSLALAAGGVFCACIGLAITANLVGLPGQTLSRLWEFGGGMVVAFVFVKGHGSVLWRPGRKHQRRRVAAAAVAAALLFLMLSKASVLPPLGPVPTNVLDVLAAFCFVVGGLLVDDWQPSRRRGYALVAVGDWSYSIYLIHILWIAVALPLVLQLGLPAPFFTSILFMVVYASSLASSRFLYSIVEQPFVALGRKLERVLRASGASGETQS